MTLVKKLLLGAVPTVAGGTGVGVFIYEKTKNEDKPGEVQTSDKGLQAEEKPGESQTKEVQESPPAVPNDGQNKKVTTQKPDPKDLELIKKAGMNCGEAEYDSECSILTVGLKLEVSNVKKENLVFSGNDNGKIKVRLDKKSKYKGGFRFAVVEKNISLNNGSETITLNRYENYSLDVQGNNVYLKRIMTVDQGKIKVLGLPDEYTFPTTKDGSLFEIEKSLVWYVKFDGVEGVDKRPKSNDKLNLKTYKIENSKIFKGGYRFSFQPFADLTIPSNEGVLDKDIWWDFRLKDADADDLFLERVWKKESELLGAVGLTCDGEDCQISDGKLKIKRGNFKGGELSKGEGSGKIKVYKKRSGHYEGLRFEIKEGDIGLSSSEKLEEMEVYEILRDDDDSYYLTRKHDVKEVIVFLLGLNGCSLPTGETTSCTIENGNLGKLKFFGGGEEKTISGSGTLNVTITTADKSTYPFGYKFSLNTSGEMKIGDDTTLSGGSSQDFKIKKDESKLYLEKLGD